MLFRIEKFLFLLLLFSLPFQTRVFLWSAGAVEGFNEWQSAFLYGTDMIVLALFFLFILRRNPGISLGRRKREGASFVEMPEASRKTSQPLGRSDERSEEQVGVFRKRARQSISKSERVAAWSKLIPGFLLKPSRLRRSKFITPTLFLGVFLLFALVSIFSAPYLGVGVYRLLKLAEFIGLFFYTIHIMRKVKFEHAAIAFVFGGLLQALIAVTQFFSQHSLGLKFLGESPLEAGRSEVAEFIAFGSRFMRAYGTFPSPNVLAAYLALAILFLIAWHLGRKALTQREKIFAWQAIILLSFALLLTFSRASIAAFALAFTFFLLMFARRGMRQYVKKLFSVLAPLIAGVLAMTVAFWPEIYSRIFTTFAEGDFAMRERVFFNNLSFQVISDNLGGVGIGNYTLFLREEFFGLRDTLYQPVHNIFLLSFAELGILGGAVFIMFCAYTLFLGFRTVKNTLTPQTLIIFTAFLFIMISGFFDHFYLTLQQGTLMFWITGAMLYAEIKT